MSTPLAIQWIIAIDVSVAAGKTRQPRSAVATARFLAVAALIAFSGDQLTGQSCFVAAKKWARWLGCHPATIWRYRDQLMAEGWLIQTAKPAPGRAAEYRLMIPTSRTATPNDATRSAGTDSTATPDDATRSATSRTTTHDYATRSSDGTGQRVAKSASTPRTTTRDDASYLLPTSMAGRSRNGPVVGTDDDHSRDESTDDGQPTATPHGARDVIGGRRRDQADARRTEERRCREADEQAARVRRWQNLRDEDPPADPEDIRLAAKLAGIDPDTGEPLSTDSSDDTEETP